MGADDFMQRLEMALYAFGFTGDNSIAMVNLCRDEVTVTLKHRIEQIFGSSFSTNGLGGVLTCGKTGMGAGFSHSPLCSSNKERYVFFSFPHISINSRGEVGPMARPGRHDASCACGALIKAHAEIRTQGLMCNCKIPGVHEPLEPEYSILKQRIARRLRHEGNTDESVKSLSLGGWASQHWSGRGGVGRGGLSPGVITGVQIHNWSNNFEDDSPNLEFVAPTSVYVVVGGEKTHLDLSAMPPVTPRQMRAIAGPADVINQGGQTLLREEAAPYAFDSKDARRRKRERLLRYISLMREEGLEAEAELLEASMQSRLGLQAKIARGQPGRIEGDTSVVIDQKAAAASVRELQEIRQLLEEKHRQQQVVKEQQEEQKKAYAAAAAAQQVQQRQAPAPPQAGPK
ncbi:hypothetical protein CHLNCDRAFT_33527 [Chlorella variabilis]|uniref:Limiting CO2-inducible protein B/C beta carbonyic anhydrase domain-containing protein n=1 Tax=Chlorella variabilis TaxID=554065 RepID=E1Z2J4_CHLVA|nr:hypothetical protein CHLNCDRAFT_33527 [Chlorella variabilis]EFN59671.1 hypothetical protein CHLNCDRAFT_33527 [Chlorella variabilis]|eukprot:XP_005851773.1 hypothetical protein CHLNCDRAFT_33527 [Chlorella variabilis]